MFITNTPNIYPQRIQKCRQPSFQGLLHIDPQTKVPLDSWFFRDINTITTATQEVKKEFPNGTNILDFACSNGEEMISLKALLPEKEYKLIGYDSSSSALKLARKGLYTIFSHWYDSFLLPQERANGIQQKLKNNFYNIMEETVPEDKYPLINNKTCYFRIKNSIPNFQEKFFKIKASYANDIDIRSGNIMNLDEFRIKNIGAIFFRNALYQMTGNDLNERIEQRKFLETPNVNKKELIEKFVDKIHKKLEKGGVFVIGNHIKDHVFLADQNTPEEETIKFFNTEFFDKDNHLHKQASELRLYKKSPLVSALEKGKRFIPIGYSTTHLEYGGVKIKIPTVWKKIK